MKNFALLFITLFGVFNAHTAFGQQKKIDIDHFKRKMEFLGLPNSNKLKAFNTYNISFTAKQESINTLEITAKDIASFFHLEGHSYLQTGDADFIYSIQIGEPTILKEELIESMGEIKNPDGTKTNVTQYSAAIEMSAPTVIQLINNESGEVLHVAVLSTPSHPSVYKSTPTTKDGATRMLGMKTAGLNLHVKKMYIDALNAEIRKIKSAYSFEKQSYDQEFMDVDVKKSPDLTDLHNEIIQVSTALSNAPYRESLLKTQLILQSTLIAWTSAADKLSSEDKYEKKLKFVYLFNIAVAQLWLEQFDDAINTSEKIILNDHKTYEAGIIKENANQVKAYLSSKGYRSRHFHRPGFYSDYTYTYTKQTVEKKHWNFIAQTASDIKQLEDIVTDVKNIGKGLIDDLTLGDSIIASNAFYSTIKFEMDGTPYEYKKASLSIGSGAISEKCYALNCYTREGLIVKQGSFDGMSVALYSKNGAPTMSTVKSLLEKYKGQLIGDIYTTTIYDSVPYKINDNWKAPKLITWEQYGKDLAADVEFDFNTSNGDDFYAYKTMNGDQFQIELISSSPIVVKGNGGSYAQGYMAKFKIPSIKLTRFWYGHYSPRYSEDYKEIKNLEFYIVFR